MFKVGDKVVYPMYGAGIIQNMEEKNVDGKEERYYVIGMPASSSKITIPVGKAENNGLRQVVRTSEVLNTLNNSLRFSDEGSSDWNKRYKDNMEKIKTGQVEKMAQVASSLHKREKERGLSNAEKKMLTTVKQILVSELVLSDNLAKEEAEVQFLKALNRQQKDNL